MARLRRTSPDQPGWTRRRSGTGFVYLDREGTRVTDPGELQRIRDLVVPPAWTDVWICPLPHGHLQAVGTDARGRRQYLYHPAWREQRDRLKHDRMVAFARRLPAARELVADHLALPGMPRERALATAFRLLDRGFFRVGGEIYAEENGSYGLATLLKEHARADGEAVVFDYVAKSGARRRVRVDDPAVASAVATLRRRRSGGPELLAWREGRAWRDVGSDDVNAYVKEVVAPDASAKDFRTWHATVLAAVCLASCPPPASSRTAAREVTRAVRQVARHLGNTPAVCRASYVDPRVLERYADGSTVASAVRRAGQRALDEVSDADTEPDGVVSAVLPPAAHAAVERAVVRLLAR